MIYWDNNATTPLLPEAREAMLPFLGEVYANPSSPYSAARGAGRAISNARDQLGTLLGADSKNLIFTSGGTESINLAFHLAKLAEPQKQHIVTVSTEHAAVLGCAEQSAGQGCRVTLLPVDEQGQLNLDSLRDSLCDDTALVSVMAANNETGVIHPVQEIADLAKNCGAYFHCDGSQAAGKIPVSLRSFAPDFYSVSGHKFHGPKGSGALYISDRVPAGSLFQGGDQEFGRRAGTENVAAIAGLGMAAIKAKEFIDEASSIIPESLKVIEDIISKALPQARFLAPSAQRLPNTRLLLHPGVEAEAVIALLDEKEICVSSGSACASGSVEPSHVLRAMGVPDAEARSAIRLSASRLNTVEEAGRVADSLIDIIHRLATMNL